MFDSMRPLVGQARCEGLKGEAPNTYEVVYSNASNISAILCERELSGNQLVNITPYGEEKNDKGKVVEKYKIIFRVPH